MSVVRVGWVWSGWDGRCGDWLVITKKLVLFSAVEVGGAYPDTDTLTHTHTHAHTHTGRYLKELRKQFQDKLAEANNVAEETVSNMRTVKSFSNELKMATMYRTEIDLSYKLGRNLAVLLGNPYSI